MLPREPPVPSSAHNIELSLRAFPCVLFGIKKQQAPRAHSDSNERQRQATFASPCARPRPSSPPTADSTRCVGTAPQHTL
mmetsp:Transcript_20216/g.61552  ORF Transcript_20216/g.61552 Transcript_20216/m.61552 type:complete len:80 (+) Transcript_20216:57-296(+)